MARPVHRLLWVACLGLLLPLDRGQCSDEETAPPAWSAGEGQPADAGGTAPQTDPAIPYPPERPTTTRVLKVPKRQQPLGNQQPSMVTADYMELEFNNTQRQLHNFLTTLSPFQHKLLLDYLRHQLHTPQFTGAEEMMSELKGDTGVSESAQVISQLAQAFFYYHIYVYDPILTHADKLSLDDDEGLTMPHIVAMSQYLQDMFPKSQPYLSVIMTAPIALSLFGRNYSSEAPIDKALSTSAYGALLALSAQATGSILKKHTTYNSFSAAMLASAYRHYLRGNYAQATIDSVLTMLNLREKRGVIYSALGAAFMASLGLPPADWPLSRYMDANHIMPLILAACLTEDWASSFVAGTVMLLNQYLLYQPADYYLEHGMVYPNTQAYWFGMGGVALAATLTLLLNWHEVPALSHTSATAWNLFNGITNGLNYLVFADEVDPGDDKSKLIGYLSKLQARLKPATLYHGENRVLTEHNYGTREEIIAAHSQAQNRTLIQNLSDWMAWFQGKQPTSTAPEPPKDSVDNPLESPSEDQTNLPVENRSPEQRTSDTEAEMLL